MRKNIINLCKSNIRFVVHTTSLLFVFFLSSCKDNKEVLKDAIDVLANKTEIEQEKEVGDDVFILSEYNNSDFYNNIGNLKLANVDKLKKNAVFKVGKRDGHFNYDYFNSFFSDNEIVTAISNSIIVRYDISTKEIVWQSDIDVVNMTKFISGGITRVANYLIVTVGSSRIYALDFDTGAVIWQRDVTTNVRSVPLVLDDVLYTQTITNKSYALDYRTGEILWFNDFSAKLTTVFGSGEVSKSDSLVMLPSSHGYLISAQKGSGKKVWTEKVIKPGLRQSEFTLTDIESKVIMDGSTMYISSFNDSFLAVDINNGKRLWQKEIGMYKDFWLSGNYLFGLSKDDKIFALDKKDGQIIWVNDVPYSKEDNLCSSKPFIVNGFVGMIVSNGKLILFDSKTGEVKKKSRIAKGVCEDFYVKDEVLYLITSEGKFYKYAN